MSGEKEKLVNTVLSLFLRDNTFTRESPVARKTKEQLQKMTYAQLDAIGILLLGKRRHD